MKPSRTRMVLFVSAGTVVLLVAACSVSPRGRAPECSAGSRPGQATEPHDTPATPAPRAEALDDTCTSECMRLPEL